MYIDQIYEKYYHGKEPGYFELTGSEEETKKIISANMPGFAFPDEKEMEESKKIRENAINIFNSVFTDNLNLIKSSAENYEREHKLKARELSDFEKSLVDCTDDDSSAFLKQLYEADTPDKKNRILFDAFVRMFDTYNNRDNDAYMGPDISDKNLSEAYPFIMSVLSPLDKANDFAELLESMKRDNQLTQEEIDKAEDIKKQIPDLFGLRAILKERMNIILNPLYPYIGTSMLNHKDAKAITSGFNMKKSNKVFDGLPEYKELCHSLSEKKEVRDSLFELKLTNDTGGNYLIISPENRDVSSNNFKRDDFYIKLPNDDNTWHHLVRDENGIFQEEPITEDVKANLSVEYNYMYIINHLQDKNGTYSFFNDNYERFDMSSLGYEDAKALLKQLGSFIFHNNETKETVHVNIRGNAFDVEYVETGDIKPAREERTKQELDEYFSARGMTCTQISYDILNQHKNDPLGAMFALLVKMGGLQDELNKFTEAGRAEKDYTNVVDAVSYYCKRSPSMSSSEKRAVLSSICSLAEIWLNGKKEFSSLTEDALKKTDPGKKYLTMKNVLTEVTEYGRALDAIKGLGYSLFEPDMQEANKPVNVYHAYQEEFLDGKAVQEELSRISRRALRNMPFNKNSFAIYKTMYSMKDREFISISDKRQKIEEVLSSPASTLLEEYASDHPHFIIKDEKEADRIYEIANTALEMANTAVRFENRRFEEFYNKVYDRALRQGRTGNADLDAAIRRKMLSVLADQARRRDCEIDTDGRLYIGNSEASLSTARRRRMIKSASFFASDGYVDDIFKYNANTLKAYDKASQQLRENLARSIFNRDYAFAGYLFKTKINNLYSERQKPFVIMFACLMAPEPDGAGLSIEEIIDPKAKLSEKRELGRRILEDLAKPKEERTYTHRKISRIVMDHAPRMQDHVLAAYKDAEKYNTISMAEFASAAGPLTDGLFDMISQAVVTKDMWEQAKAGETLRTFAHEGESEEDTKNRVNCIAAKAEYLKEQTISKTTYIKECTNIERLLHKNIFDENDRTALNDAIARAFDANFFKAAYDQLPETDTAMEAEKYALGLKYINILVKNFFDHVLKDYNVQEKLHFIMDPAFTKKISIQLKVDDMKKFEDPEVETVMQMTSGFDKTASVVLSLNDGTSLPVSPDMLMGQEEKMTREQKAFMDKFANEIHALSADHDYSLDNIRADYESRVNNLPGKSPELDRLFINYRNEIEDIYDSLSFNGEIASRAGITDADPASYIVIGDQTGESLLQNITSHAGISSEILTVKQKNMVLSAICAAAMRNGQTVTMINCDPVSENTLCREIWQTDLKLSSSLTGKIPDKDCENALNLLWKSQKRFLNKSEDKTPKEAHDNKIKQVKESFTKRTNEIYIRDNQWFGRNFLLNRNNVRNIIDHRDTFRKNILEIAWTRIRENNELAMANNGKNGPENLPQADAVYKFANNLTLDPVAAILTIAYSISFESKDGEEQLISPGHKFENTLSNDEMDIIGQAAEKYSELLKMQKKQPGTADKTMRKYITQCLLYRNTSEITFEDKKAVNEPKEIRNNPIPDNLPGGNAGPENLPGGNAGPGNLPRKDAPDDVAERAAVGAGNLWFNSQLISFIANDNAAAGLGSSKSMQSAKLKDVFAANKIISKDDFTDGLFFEAAEKMNKVYTSKNIPENFKHVKELLGQYTYLKNSPRANPEGKTADRMTFEELTESCKKADTFTKEMIKAQNIPDITTDPAFGKKVVEQIDTLQHITANSEKIFRNINDRLERQAQANHAPIRQAANAVPVKQ